MSDLTPEDLIQAWVFQDKIEDMAKSLLLAGMELGVKATTLTMAEMRLQGKLDLDDEGIYDLIGSAAFKKAAEKIKEKLDAKREN